MALYPARAVGIDVRHCQVFDNETGAIEEGTLRHPVKLCRMLDDVGATVQIPDGVLFPAGGGIRKGDLVEVSGDCRGVQDMDRHRRHPLTGSMCDSGTSKPWRDLCEGESLR